jgi:YggT family protein
MIIMKILGSWLPNLKNSHFMLFISHYTDPYLNIFRRFIPPIGGVLDISPLLGFIALKMIEKLVIWLLLSI